MTEPVLVHVGDVWKRYHWGRTVIDVLHGVTLRAAPGEFVLVTGSSGAGKTTLLNILAALDYPDQGHVVVAGTSLASLSRRASAQYRNRTVGIVYQAYNLLPQLTALENVLLPAIPGGQPDPARGRALLAAVGLGDRILHRPSELSGGEQQRVAIARSLMNDPPLLLADEPTGNLDKMAGAAVRALLRGAAKKQGKTVIVVSHDRSWASVADATFILRDGELHHAAGSFTPGLD